MKNLGKISTRQPTPKVAMEPTLEVATEPAETKNSKLNFQQEFTN